MVAFLYRPLVIGLPIALMACVNSAPTVAEQDTSVPLGIDLGGSGPVTVPVADHTVAPRTSGEMRMAHAGHADAHGSGTVNSVDPAQHKINLSHQAIPDIGWPAMTMDFPVAPSVDLKTIKAGTRVNFTIERGEGGMYEIRAIAPAGGGR
jgi:Cu/Ag efflux protein CusF